MRPEAGGSKDWIQLDQLAEEIGEDPGRWLDGPLDPLPRIRGLASIAAVRGWKGSERKIARIRGREPRGRILEALDEREGYLQRIGEEPPRREGREVPEKEWRLNGEPWEAVDRSGALASLRGPQNRTVATDGGEDRDE